MTIRLGFIQKLLELRQVENNRSRYIFMNTKNLTGTKARMGKIKSYLHIHFNSDTA